MNLVRHPVFWLILVVAAAFVYVPLHGNNIPLREDLVLVAVAIILATNLNLMIGYTGYVNFGHIVFYGLGGYVGLYLATVRNWNLLLAALAAGVAVSGFALLLGLGILRLRGAYLPSPPSASCKPCRHSPPTSIPGDAPPACMSPSSPTSRWEARCRRSGWFITW